MSVHIDKVEAHDCEDVVGQMRCRSQQVALCGVL